MNPLARTHVPASCAVVIAGYHRHALLAEQRFEAREPLLVLLDAARNGEVTSRCRLRHMRWLWVMAIIGVGCIPPMDGVDAGTKTVEPGPIPVDPRTQDYDPCVWDGLSDEGVCSTPTWVFEGAACRSACGPRPRFGRPGVFATEAECKAACPCNTDKFLSWPFNPEAGHDTPFGFCDEVLAFTDAGAPEVPGLGCTTSSNGSGRIEDQVCLIGALEQTSSAISKACRASVEPQVYGVTCVVSID